MVEPLDCDSLDEGSTVSRHSIEQEGKVRPIEDLS
jgi:hypothetical protein